MSGPCRFLLVLRSLGRSGLLAALVLLVPAGLSAQSPGPGVGTIIMAHGGDSGWNARVFELAREVRTGGPVKVGFLMGPGALTARFQDAVARLKDQAVREIVVVPLLVSSYSGHYEQVRYLAGLTNELSESDHHHLHMAGITRPADPLPMRVTPALDDAGGLARALADRALALAREASSQAVFLIAHGPNDSRDHALWMEKLRTVADSVKKWSGFRDVRVDLVRDDAPAIVRAEMVRRIRDVIELQYAATGKDVVVVPVLISTGVINRHKLRQDLAGLPVVYAGEPLLPHPALAKWVEEQVAAALASPGGGR